MRRPKSRHGFCSACVRIRILEAHHCVPQRYEKATTNSEMVHLCAKCHLELHREWVDPLGKQPREVFLDITRQFLWEKRN